MYIQAREKEHLRLRKSKKYKYREEIIMLNVFLSDLGKYTEGELTGDWYALDTYEGREDFLSALKEIQTEGSGEFFISDYESDFISVSEHPNINTLIEVGEIFEDNPLMLEDMISEVVLEHDDELAHLLYTPMELLNDELEHLEPIEILNKMHFGEFNPTHDYFKFDGYMNLESISEWEYEKILEDEAMFITEAWLNYVHGVEI